MDELQQKQVPNVEYVLQKWLRVGRRTCNAAVWMQVEDALDPPMSMGLTTSVHKLWTQEFFMPFGWDSKGSQKVAPEARGLILAAAGAYGGAYAGLLAARLLSVSLPLTGQFRL